MAVLHARSELKAGDRFIGRSIIGSRFDCRIERETTVGKRAAIVPSITLVGMLQPLFRQWR